MAHVPRPVPGEIPAGYAVYADRVPAGEVDVLLERQGGHLAGLLAAIPEERGGFRYAPGKWSIKDLVGHLADTERIMAYRLLCVAREERTPLPGFEEDDYARAAQADARPLADLAEEFAAVRRSTLALVRGLAPGAWTRRGTVNGKQVSPADLAYVIAGHTIHHLEILQERYLGGGGLS
ncbi:DinB family protein [Mesoterricola silvestris]|uniref:DinB-like domain-containing protein n=1 Tax=Mesoterricola silvestris TaxID=2927979 RepID=A0AA48K8H3_9BACT|nr:DinB family protein [Mesoterricola silvestris]BDU72291.1 hypothetical protein METEAL_14650 [Mesoterricola silvestris]